MAPTRKESGGGVWDRSLQFSKLCVQDYEDYSHLGIRGEAKCVM